MKIISGIDVLAAVASLIVISMIVVMCGEVVKRRNQNWPMVMTFALGMPIFAIIMSGVIGSLMG